MNCVCLDQNHSAYPPSLNRYLGNDAPTAIATLGNLEILRQHKLALFSSVSCPAALMIQAHDLAQALAQAGVTVIGGFHSPVEKECLTILLRGSQPVVICPARSFTKMRIRTELKEPLEAGRLLFLSPFAHHRHRSDVKMTLYRNRFVAALADQIFVPYAAPGSKTEQLCMNIIAWGKSLYTVSSDENSNVIALGAHPMSPDQVFQLQMPG
jgi:predicted Rossmann fold nucleotide-binding protein DprA/Smf involved in DNA uptake